MDILFSVAGAFIYCSAQSVHLRTKALRVCVCVGGGGGGGGGGG